MIDSSDASSGGRDDPGVDAEGTDALIGALLRDAAEEHLASAELVVDPVGATRRRMRVRRRRRNLVFGAAAGFVGVMAVTTAIVVSNGRDSQSLEAVSPSTVSSSAPAPTSSPEGSAAPTTPGLDEVPLEFRQDVAMAWTGREVVVWGGDIEAFNQGVSGQNRTFSDGAAFDVASGSWRMMSPGPITEVGVDHDRRAVAVDDGVVVANGTDVALWNPAANTWRSMENLPNRSGRVDIVGAGNVVVSIGAGSRLDVDSGEWTAIAEPPMEIETQAASPAVVSAGEEVIILGRAPGFPPGPMRAAAYDPDSDTWRVLPDPPASLGGQAPTATWDGDRLIVVTYDMGAATYDPDSDSWTDLPSVPARFSEWLPLTVSSGGTTVTSMAQATVVLDADDRWTPLPHGDLPMGPTLALDPPGAPTGRVATWSVDNEAQTSSLVITDLRHIASSTARRQVGVASVDLAPQDHTAGTSYGTEGGGLIENVALELEVAEGGACTVTSTYLGMLGSGTSDLPVSEEFTGPDGASTRWWRNEAGTTWETWPTTSDRFRIECNAANAAERLARSVISP